MLPLVTFQEGDPRANYRGAVVAVGGPPDSGKSVFVLELYERLCRLRPRGIYLEHANPDGEGQWRRDSPASVAERLRRRAEQKFRPEFFNHLLQGLPGLIRAYPLLLLDLGGMRSDENAAILRHATHGIIVSRNQKKLNEWRRFMTENDCRPAACLLTELRRDAGGNLDTAALSTVDFTVQPVMGTLVNLDHDAPATPYSDAVQSLANWLLDGR